MKHLLYWFFAPKDECEFHFVFWMNSPFISTQPVDYYCVIGENAVMKIVLSLLLCVSLMNCSNDGDNDDHALCDAQTLISAEQYAAAPADYLVVNQLEIKDHCLKINFSSSGCSGSSWIVKLIDSGAVALSDPPQRNLRLSLKNEEMCEAFITKEISFDISNLQVDGNRVHLNIVNSDKQILYRY